MAIMDGSVAAELGLDEEEGGEGIPEEGGDGTFGGLPGRYFNYQPAPPVRDLLSEPLVASPLPPNPPEEAWQSRFARWLTARHLKNPSADTRQQWKVFDTITLVAGSAFTAAASGPAPSPGPASAPAPAPGKEGAAARKVQVFHPYNLNYAFDLLLKLDKRFAYERKYLDQMLALVLNRHAALMTERMGEKFFFHSESIEYFRAAYRNEGYLRRPLSPEEKYEAVQKLYDNYYHGQRYYMFAVLRRERLEADNRLFTFYCRAAYFMARVDWNGGLFEKPPVRALPSRSDLMALARRDASVVHRAKANLSYADQINGIVKAFPA